MDDESCCCVVTSEVVLGGVDIVSVDTLIDVDVIRLLLAAVVRRSLVRVICLVDAVVCAFVVLVVKDSHNIVVENSCEDVEDVVDSVVCKDVEDVVDSVVCKDVEDVVDSVVC